MDEPTLTSLLPNPHLLTANLPNHIFILLLWIVLSLAAILTNLLVLQEVSCKLRTAFEFLTAHISATYLLQMALLQPYIAVMFFEVSPSIVTVSYYGLKIPGVLQMMGFIIFSVERYSFFCRALHYNTGFWTCIAQGIMLSAWIMAGIQIVVIVATSSAYEFKASIGLGVLAGVAVLFSIACHICIGKKICKFLEEECKNRESQQAWRDAMMKNVWHTSSSGQSGPAQMSLPPPVSVWDTASDENRERSCSTVQISTDAGVHNVGQLSPESCSTSLASDSNQSPARTPQPTFRQKRRCSSLSGNSKNNTLELLNLSPIPSDRLFVHGTSAEASPNRTDDTCDPTSPSNITVHGCAKSPCDPSDHSTASLESSEQVSENSQKRNSSKSDFFKQRFFPFLNSSACRSSSYFVNNQNVEIQPLPGLPNGPGSPVSTCSYTYDNSVLGTDSPNPGFLNPPLIISTPATPNIRDASEAKSQASLSRHSFHSSDVSFSGTFIDLKDSPELSTLPPRRRFSRIRMSSLTDLSNTSTLDIPSLGHYSTDNSPVCSPRICSITAPSQNYLGPGPLMAANSCGELEDDNVFESLVTEINLTHAGTLASEPSPSLSSRISPQYLTSTDDDVSLRQQGAAGKPSPSLSGSRSPQLWAFTNRISLQHQESPTISNGHPPSILNRCRTKLDSRTSVQKSVTFFDLLNEQHVPTNITEQQSAEGLRQKAQWKKLCKAVRQMILVFLVTLQCVSLVALDATMVTNTRAICMLITVLLLCCAVHPIYLAWMQPDVRRGLKYKLQMCKKSICKHLRSHTLTNL